MVAQQLNLNVKYVNQHSHKLTQFKAGFLFIYFISTKVSRIATQRIWAEWVVGLPPWSCTAVIKCTTGLNPYSVLIGWVNACCFSHDLLPVGASHQSSKLEIWSCLKSEELQEILSLGPAWQITFFDLCCKINIDTWKMQVLKLHCSCTTLLYFEEIDKTWKLTFIDVHVFWCMALRCHNNRKACSKYNKWEVECNHLQLACLYCEVYLNIYLPKENKI